ncbi:tannase and feruloyl esterase [Colletotrichum cuscutae]|uniref:Carboxylic ester hydrolase n=1 Tax=Colletotrichum cuscutae TaxID=1209917 RepID=A0AAI9UYJ5_9PEZI|nr:tannase and feruloyl esterase [Colletotrichum cuscutae]
MTLALWLLPTTSVAKAKFSTQCDSLPSLIAALASNIRVITTSSIPTHSLNVSGTFNQVAFCRVNGSVPYPENNNVFYEVWLQESITYNDRFLAVGNGGLAGRIDYASMLENVNKGFATSGGDSGRLASDNDDGDAYPGGIYLPFLHDQNQVLAWIRNSIALFTPVAKNRNVLL